jgi:hypothetical protein
VNFYIVGVEGGFSVSVSTVFLLILRSKTFLSTVCFTALSLSSQVLSIKFRDRVCENTFGTYFSWKRPTFTYTEILNQPGNFMDKVVYSES